MPTIKDILADIGIDAAKEFCVINSITEPQMDIIRDPKDRQCELIRRIGTCGYYRNNKFHVAVPLCAHQNPNYSWASYISDRTPFGVIQHELGHYVDEKLSNVSNIYSKNNSRYFSDEIRAVSKEPPITAYAPNTMEWFAEIFRLFVTNPNLLKMIRPKAHKALLDNGLKPITDVQAEDMLNQFKAPAKIFERLQKTLKK